MKVEMFERTVLACREMQEAMSILKRGLYRDENEHMLFLKYACLCVEVLTIALNDERKERYE